MDALKEKLVKLATEKFGDIQPCSATTELDESFSEEEGMLIFWFNDVENSTHIVTSEMV
jgi:hypothetical protein